MLAIHRGRGPLIAILLSMAAVGSWVVIQGILVFRREVTEGLASDPARVQRFLLANDDRRALVVRTVYPRRGVDYVQSHSMLGVYDLTVSRPSFCCWRDHLPVRTAICVSHNGYVFVSAEGDGLYWFHTKAVDSQLNYLGRDGTSSSESMEFRPYANVLECSDDGSLVIASNLGTAAWDRQSGRLLWRQPAVVMVEARFIPRTTRLICALDEGRVIELNPLTGEQRHEIGNFSCVIERIAISHDGARLALRTGLGDLIVCDLDTNQVLGSRSVSSSGGDVLYSFDDKELWIANPDRNIECVVLSSSSLKPLRYLRGTGKPIVGLRLTKAGTAYTWNSQGTISAWNAATGAVIHQFSATENGKL